MQPSGLNVFQRLARQWDSLHPYNAAQAMKLVDLPDSKTLETTWRKTLAEMGLKRFGQPEIHLADSLDELMTAELNRPFGDLPLRAFAMKDGSYVGVVYHHWAADSYSIRLLLREWFLRMHNPAAARKMPLRKADRGYWRHFGPSQSNWSIGGAAMQMFRWSARFRKSRRVDPEAMRDLQVHFTFHHAPVGLITSVAAAARKMGVTVNDVFLAAMAHVCDELVPARRTPKRPDLALGTIVDLRTRARPPLEDFGLFLGFTSVFCTPAEMTDWGRLLHRINLQNKTQKQSAAAESSMIRLMTGVIVAKIFNRKRLLEFYRKRLALAGGISNVNLNRDWPAKYHPSPLIEYVRVSPAGPMMPLVFTPTTLGDTLSFGLTCRSSVIPPEKAAALAETFIANLHEFVEWATAAVACDR